MPLLQLTGIIKSFGGLRALDRVNFAVEAGEVMALVGDNGAGKSTLSKVISGAYQPDAGTMSLRGVAVNFLDPQDAVRAGIATIYQELALAGKMTVADNLDAGGEVGGGSIRPPVARRSASSVFSRQGCRRTIPQP